MRCGFAMSPSEGSVTTERQHFCDVDNTVHFTPNFMQTFDPMQAVIKMLRPYLDNKTPETTHDMWRR